MVKGYLVNPNHLGYAEPSRVTSKRKLLGKTPQKMLNQSTSQELIRCLSLAHKDIEWYKKRGCMEFKKKRGAWSSKNHASVLRITKHFISFLPPRDSLDLNLWPLEDLEYVCDIATASHNKGFASIYLTVT